MKSDKLPQVMSLESVSVWSEDYKFDKMRKIWGCGVTKTLLTDLQRSDLCSPLLIFCLRLEATLAATSITHLNL